MFQTLFYKLNVLSSLQTEMLIRANINSSQEVKKGMR